MKLAKRWLLGPQVGGGGFGRVFDATRPGESPAVAKLVPKAPGAEREMLFVNLAGVRNVVPIIDSGEHDTFWVLVMPKAVESLADRLSRAAIEPVELDEALAVLRDVVTALVDLDGRVVHRDIKPANILLVGGAWSLADFGISRYAEATTAPDTRKFALSPPYAAPERWRSERATSATDVYSLGVVAFEMIAGTLPFPGPTLDQFRDQHLHSDPPALAAAPSLVASLVDECLSKGPQARPTPANLDKRLLRASERAASPERLALREANRAEVRRRAEQSRVESERRTEEERRAALAADAKRSIAAISDALYEALLEDAPAAEASRGTNGEWTLTLGLGRLSFLAPKESLMKWSAASANPFDVIVHSAITLQRPHDFSGYAGRSHSLWYCDCQAEGEYHWYETAFMNSGLSGTRNAAQPFALDPGDNAGQAVRPLMAAVQVAWPFTELSVGDLDEFIDRWATWFGLAANGQLGHPTQMPERDVGGWRKGGNL